jgi:two-component system chemotaxis response regulator CheB
MVDRAIRVVVAEDSTSTRDLLVRLLQAGGFDVVGVAQDGAEAVALVHQLRPDVVTMDIHMPRLNGIQATRRIMAETPVPIVIVSASVEEKEVGLAFEAMRVGAVTVLDKPPGPRHPCHAMTAREFLRTVRLMAGVKVVRRSGTGPLGSAGKLPFGTQEPSSFTTPMQNSIQMRPRVIALAASTGGPQAIQALLQALGRVDVPIFIVQHISLGFTSGMADWLTATCRQTVKIAMHGEEPQGYTVYLAAEDHHLIVTRLGKIGLSKAPAVRGFRPSANVLFESVAECFGASAVGILLTGMGDDGAAGLGALRAAGALTIAQDEATSVVYGMPRAAVASGAATEVLPLTAIAPRLRGLLELDT